MNWKSFYCEPIMASGWPGLGQYGAKRFDFIESSDENGRIWGVNVNGSESVEKWAQNASQNAFVLNIDAQFMQIGRENGMSFGPVNAVTAHNNTEESDEHGPIMREFWKPSGILCVGRSRTGFPGKRDHLVQLLVCKNQRTTEALDIRDKYDLAVTVTYDETGDRGLKTPDYQCTRIKSETKCGVYRSMAGVIGFLFRFHEQNTKYKINFALRKVPPKKKRKKKIMSEHSACETVSEISITLQTGSAVFGKLGKRTIKMKTQKVPPCSELGPASLSEESMELCKRSSWVMRQLQSLRDNAKWNDFDKFSNQLLLQFPDIDTQITIKLEQSVAACYRNDLDGSLQIIDESFKLMPQATNVQLLAGRGHGYRAGVLRRLRSLGQAEHYVQLAEQNNLACHTNLDTSFIVYERASVLLDFIGRTSQRSPKQVSEALRNLEKCIDVCRRVERQDSELYVKKHHFALIKIAMLLLDCRTDAARKRVLREESIAKGQECLNTLKTKYWSEIPEGVKIQFNLASSDLEYRRGNYTEAERFASLAKDRAVELGFNTEISHAQERLNHTRALTRSDRGTITNGLRLFPASPSGEHVRDSASEGENGDISSSGSESDWLRILE